MPNAVVRMGGVVRLRNRFRDIRTYFFREATRSMECPPNFGQVGTNVYRSSFPKPEHFPFVQSLGLRSILLLLPEPYPEVNIEFCEKNNIQLYQIGMSGNKEPFVHMDPERLKQAVETVIDPANQPVLIHCNQGKHRTGCLVGCLRRTQGWSLAMIFEEYRRYAYPKVRALDQLIIELYAPEEEDRQRTEFLWS